MEAAGLVLGIIPIAIKGLYSYRDIVSSIKNARRDLDCLIRDLKTEQQILQNTCEILLKSIAPDNVIDGMIETPFGREWKVYDNEVQARLWLSSTVFREHVEDMREAAVELQRKLALDKDGKTRFSNRITILEEWKQNAYFSLNRKDYKDILARLKDGNAALNTLATQSSKLDSTRRSRSQANLARIIRKLSREVYAAFRDVFNCGCSHDLGLGLAALCRKDVILPGNDGQDAAKAIQLDIIVGSGGKTPGWDRLRVQLAEDKVAVPPPPPSLPQPRAPKRVRWSPSLFSRASSSTTCVTETTAQGHYTSYLSTSLQVGTETLLSPITDICHTLQEGKYKIPTTTDCLGNISCNSGRFNLYRQDLQHEPLGAVSLSTILGGERDGGGFIEFGYTERLKLALSLSYSVLHLYKTPWLAKSMGPEDIVFLKMEKQASSEVDLDGHRPFLTKTLSLATPTTAQVQSTQAEARPVDLTILSLGLLLIQIMIGRQGGDLAFSPDMDFHSMLSKEKVASRYIASVLESGGMNYARAVQWCLGSVFSVACLSDDKFSQEFYQAVIASLEADLGTQSLMTHAVSGIET